MQDRVLHALAVLALLQLPLGCWRTRHDIQLDRATRLRPAQLATVARAPRAVRSIPTRVYVDEDYRAEVVRWREQIGAQLERANRMLEAQFGVRLQVDELRPWPRSGQTRTLAAALEELVAADGGVEVECVMGFVSFRGAIVGTMEHLGAARAFGRHLVIRNQISSAEANCLERSLDALTDREREELLSDRLRHREAVVLVHEWAHTRGAFHERDPDSIMSPMYTTKATAFSPTAARVIELALAETAPSSAVDGPGWARAYRAEVERARAEAWDSGTVASALEEAEALERGPPVTPRPP